MTDIELAALISSKICHDVIGPVGAIYNGLEVLDEDNDADSREFALSVIRASTQQASAKLQFARFAFGAAGTAGSMVDLGEAKGIAQNFVGDDKHELDWTMAPGQMPKQTVKLLLNLVANGVAALPRGGKIIVSASGDPQPVLVVRCEGGHARPPEDLVQYIGGERPATVDSRSIQSYYTCRLATAVGLVLSVEAEDEAVTLRAAPMA